MILVVGAAAVDLVAVRDAFLPGTSNPASIRLSAGGVGYNIFRHLRTPARLLTAVGRDPLSDWLAERIGGDARVRINRIEGEAPPLYAAFMEKGRLLVGASDLRAAAEGIDEAFVAQDAEALGPDDFLVMDANLDPAVTKALCRRHGARTRVVFEPVSREKAALHAAGLSGLFLATPTEGEAAALGEGGPEGYMMARDVAHLVVKRGPGGLVHYRLGRGGEVTRREYAPEAVSAAADTTGAGDRLLAGILDALQEGRPMESALRSAMSAVERCLERGKA